MIKWENLPLNMQCEEVRNYYDLIKKKKLSLFVKRMFDIVVSLVMLLILSPIIALIAVLIRLDSRGKAIFRQKRITKYGREFYIYKFRTMVDNAQEMGSQVTARNDARVTRIGKILRKYRLDEIVQLINVLKGEMSFVGTRPEVEKYVKEYSNQMLATLLLPAGVTSEASVFYKDEEMLLAGCSDVDYTYIEEILPAKMKYNLEYLKKFGFFYDIKIMLETVLALFKDDNVRREENNEIKENINV